MRPPLPRRARADGAARGRPRSAGSRACRRAPCAGCSGARAPPRARRRGGWGRRDLPYTGAGSREDFLNACKGLALTGVNGPFTMIALQDKVCPYPINPIQVRSHVESVAIPEQLPPSTHGPHFNRRGVRGSRKHRHGAVPGRAAPALGRGFSLRSPSSCRRHRVGASFRAQTTGQGTCVLTRRSSGRECGPRASRSSRPPLNSLVRRLQNGVSAPRIPRLPGRLRSNRGHRARGSRNLCGAVRAARVGPIPAPGSTRS